MRNNDWYLPRIRPRSIYPNDMLFSKHTAMPLDTNLTHRNNNVLAFGQDAESVRKSFILPNIEQGNCSFVIHDESGTLLAETRANLEEMGYDIRTLNLAAPEESNHYNPFCYLNLPDDLDDLAKSIVQNTASGNTSLAAENAEIALLNALIFYVHSAYRYESRLLVSLLHLLTPEAAEEEITAVPVSVFSELDALFHELEQTEPENPSVQYYKIFRTNRSDTEVDELLQSCAHRLQSLAVQAFSSLTQKDDLDLSSVGDKPVALFVIPSKEAPEINFLVPLFYMQLIETLYYHAETRCKNKSLPHHVRIIFDNFKSAGTISNFPYKISTMRPYNISGTIIVRSLADIRKAYPEDWEVVISSCDTHVFFGLNSANLRPEDYHYLSAKETGKIPMRDIRKVHNPLKLLKLSRNCRSGVFPFTLRILSQFAPEDCIVFVKGADPVIDKQF